MRNSYHEGKYLDAVRVLSVNVAAMNEELRNGHLIKYDDRKHLPTTSGIYSAWIDGQENPLYVGMATAPLKKRITAHFNGNRGSDRFCLYVYDHFIFPTRCIESWPNCTSKVIDKRTGEWVRTHVGFRCHCISNPGLKDKEFEAAIREIELEPIKNWRTVLNSQEELSVKS